MSETRGFRLAWLFVAMTAVAAALLLYGAPPAGASDDHDRVQLLRHGGDIVPLSAILGRPELAGKMVLEAELDEEHGRLVYELELLERDSGRVRDHCYDAVTGEPLSGRDWD